jgi:hypothetical protein
LDRDTKLFLGVNFFPKKYFKGFFGAQNNFRELISIKNELKIINFYNEALYFVLTISDKSKLIT